MALKKSLTVAGITGEYWKIERVDFQTFVKGGFSSVTVALYVDKAHSNMPHQPLATRQHLFNELVLSKSMLVASTPANIYEKLYTWLKTKPEFTGAIDA